MDATLRTGTSTLLAITTASAPSASMAISPSGRFVPTLSVTPAPAEIPPEPLTAPVSETVAAGTPLDFVNESTVPDAIVTGCETGNVSADARISELALTFTPMVVEP